METKLLVRENLTFSKKTDYFLGDKFNHFVPANKKNLYKVFSKKKIEMDEYLKNSELDLNKEEDLIRLLSYLRSFLTSINLLRFDLTMRTILILPNVVCVYLVLVFETIQPEQLTVKDTAVAN